MVDIEIKQGEDLNKIVEILSKEKKDTKEIANYHQEFKELDRKKRDTQIGKTQVDKLVTIKNESGQRIGDKLVRANRVPVAFANKIVETSLAFEFGAPLSLVPQEENNLTEQVLIDWKNCRLDHKLQKAKKAQKQETQSALLFYFKDLKPNNVVNRIVGANKNRAISCRVLDYNEGQFFPYFDETGDMKYFLFKFEVDSYEEVTYQKTRKEKMWVYSDEIVYKLSRNGVNWELESNDKHGFSKIPAVYMSQEKPEHFFVKEAIDRIETCISKLGASNDYSGHPILFIEGKVGGLPDKNADGKVMKTKVTYEEGKKIQGGDAKFLTHDNAPQSVELEIEKLEDYIYTMTSTPNISFSNLKSVGNVSGKALELMFLDSTLKKLMNEGQNRTDVERCINIIISGITTTSVVAYKSLVKETIFTIEFGNVLPNNFDELVATTAEAVTSGIMSKETAVEMLGVAENLEEEMAKIETQNIKLDASLNPVQE